MYLHNYLKDLAVSGDIDFENLPLVSDMLKEDEYPYKKQKFSEFYTKYQQTLKLPNSFRWQNYVLIGEGHYIQIFAHENWKMLLPFVGEGEDLELEHIINKEDSDSRPGSPHSMDSIPDTHRDF